jgi:hypothetical protein
MTQDYYGLATAKHHVNTKNQFCSHHVANTKPSLFENVAICHQTIAYISKAEMLI